MANIYDPLGWFVPVILEIKLMIQTLWAAKLTWDEPIPVGLQESWKALENDLASLHQVQIPRWIRLYELTTYEIHEFADDSQSAYAAMVYIEIIHNSSIHYVYQLAAKTRVATLKTTTTPRMELCASLLLAQLTRLVCTAMSLNINKVTLWSDSTIVQSWLASEHSRWEPYVSNRVMDIQELLPCRWMHVKGEDNLADLASRGISLDQLLDLQLWWHGPPWLKTTSQPYKDSIPVINEQCLNYKKRKKVCRIWPTTSNAWQDLAFPTCPSETQDFMAQHQFIDAIGDPETQKVVSPSSATTLQEILVQAMKYEAAQQATIESYRKSKTTQCCWSCGQYGHMRRNCPEISETITAPRKNHVRRNDNADALSRRPCVPQSGPCSRAEERFCVRQVTAQESNEVEEQHWTVQALRKAQREDRDLLSVLNWKESGGRPFWEDVASHSPKTKSLWRLWNSLTLRDGVLYRKWESEDVRKEPTPRSKEKVKIYNVGAPFERMLTVHQWAGEKLHLSSEKMKDRYNVKTSNKTFKEGEMVWLHDPRRKKGLSPKLQYQWEGPFKIIKCLNDVIYRFQKTPTSKPKVLHYNRLAPFRGSVPEQWTVRDNQTKLRAVLQASCCLKRSDCCLPPTPVYFLEDSRRFYELLSPVLLLLSLTVLQLAGVQLTQSAIREKYWIPSGRCLVKQILFKCSKCARFRTKPVQKLMGNFPTSRINLTRPLPKTGIDFAGPVIVKTSNLRNARYDPEDLTALTAAHFLIGMPLTVVPSLVEKAVPVLKEDGNWLNRSRQTFGKDGHIGTLVLLKEDNLPPLNCIMGRINQVYPGEDGLVRVVSIKTAVETSEELWP
ncbi:hypothetical protein LAZ67_3001200, partial [Cordylochernes scorpioides]